ncbi:MAG: FkbM family methyltransferase [Pseudomonadota bacterium]|nr:FkbM family methyltransferase [Pseudomonadota bacterium]
MPSLTSHSLTEYPNRPYDAVLFMPHFVLKKEAFSFLLRYGTVATIEGPPLSKNIAKTVKAFADLITLPLRPNRRKATKIIAAEDLAEKVEIETRLGRLFFYCNTLRAFHYPWLFHGDEPDTLAWIESLPPDACFWDIGANVGAFSLYAALMPGVKILSFEPAASSYAALIKNIEINGMDDRIAAYCLAFCESTQLNVLNMEQTEAGHSMHGFGTTVNAYDQSIEPQFRQASIGYSLDDFVRIFNPPSPTHLKLDVDGIEAEILRGGIETFQSSSLVSAIVEIMGELGSERNREILRLMDAYGFKPQPRFSPDSRNVVFER